MVSDIEKEAADPDDEDAPPVPPRTSSITASREALHKTREEAIRDEETQQGRGSYYDNYPSPDQQASNMSFYSSSSDESDLEEESDNVVTGSYFGFICIQGLQKQEWG